MKLTKIKMGSVSRLVGNSVTVVGIQSPQIQFVCKDDNIDGYIDLSRAECRELAKALIEHCNEADK